MKSINTKKTKTITQKKMEPIEDMYNVIYNYSKKIKKKVPGFTSDDIWDYICDDIPDVEIGSGSSSSSSSSNTNICSQAGLITWHPDILYTGATFSIFG